MTIKLQPVPRVLLAFTDQDNPDEWETLCALVRNYAREAVLRDRVANPRPPEQEPFGYFKAEPFGWTDCAPTDEGAIPLYERPACPPRKNQGSANVLRGRAIMTPDTEDLLWRRFNEFFRARRPDYPAEWDAYQAGHAIRSGK